jgi:uncharacterized DUF497 family protein
LPRRTLLAALAADFPVFFGWAIQVHLLSFFPLRVSRRIASCYNRAGSAGAAKGKDSVLRIDELVWDEWNEDHIGRHRVEPEEVEEVVSDVSSAFLRTRSEQAKRYLVLGLTEAGRYLFVVLEAMSGNRAYVVTAREMTDGEKRRFKAGR